jgi:hypothetical protein
MSIPPLCEIWWMERCSLSLGKPNRSSMKTANSAPGYLCVSESIPGIESPILALPSIPCLTFVSLTNAYFQRSIYSSSESLSRAAERWGWPSNRLPCAQMKRTATRTPSFQQVLDVAKCSGIGRNDACPCGSGRKFKKCCQRQA